LKQMLAAANFSPTGEPAHLGQGTWDVYADLFEARTRGNSEPSFWRYDR
jgi:hypothetical protein